jgi:hypothetical protein
VIKEIYNFSPEVFQAKLGNKKELLSKLFHEYRFNRLSETKEEIENILFQIWDEMATENLHEIFNNFADVKDINLTLLRKERINDTK